jgi:type IV secretory pathway VirJ component
MIKTNFQDSLFLKRNVRFQSLLHLRLFIAFGFLLVFSLRTINSQELPLVTWEVESNSKPMVFYISGDGGWNSFDIKMSNEYKTNKMPFVALNSFKYFWSSKTPEILAKDLIPVVRDYAKKWNKNEIIFIGYSFGGEVMPFFYTRLPEDLKAKVKLIALITPNKNSDFTIHITDMLMMDGDYKYDVVKEIEKITQPKIYCFFGEKEFSIFPKSQQPKNVKVEFVKGGHSFSDSKTVMEKILSALN